MCVPPGAHLVSPKASLLYPVAVSRHNGFRTRNNTQSSVTNTGHLLQPCTAESKSVTKPDWTPDNVQAVFLKKEPYWRNSDHLRDSPTDRQAGSPSLPAASIAAPIESSKTSKAGTFRALGRDSYILKLYSFSCTVRSWR